MAGAGSVQGTRPPERRKADRQDTEQRGGFHQVFALVASSALGADGGAVIPRTSDGFVPDYRQRVLPPSVAPSQYGA